MSTTWERTIGSLLNVIESAVSMTHVGESESNRRKRILKTATHYLMALSREERDYLAKVLVEGSVDAITLKALILMSPEEKEQDQAKGTRYGCHADLNDGDNQYDPEGCVIDDDEPNTNCMIADRYGCAEECPYFLPCTTDSKEVAERIKASESTKSKAITILG